MIKKTALLGSIVLITLLFIYCTTDESTIIGPFGNSGKYLSVANFSADKEKIYSNGDTSVVSLKVLDVNNSPAIGLRVGFSAQFGSITESDITDSSGFAFAVFISDDNTGENIITADTGIKKYTLIIDVVNYQPKYIDLFSESSRVLADGESSTIITAVLKDSVGNPMPDVTVSFSTTLGTLSPEVKLTDSTGVATTVLTSATAEGVATVTASAGIEKSIDIQLYGPAYIELSAGSLLLPADGTSFTDIVVVLKDSIGNPMPNMTVKFTTTLGTLRPEVEITDGDGMATTVLTSATAEGVATVSVSAGIEKSIDIKFQNYVPVYIELSSELPRLWADGESSTIITAVLKDSIGNPMPDMTVNFTKTLGTLSSHIVKTNGDGIATTVLTSATEEGIAIVTATSYITDSVSVEFNPYVPSTIELSASLTTILADGASTSTITAIPMDIDGTPMPNLNVLFSTTRGMLSDITSRTNQEGSAITTITSAGSPTDINAIVKMSVADDTSIYKDINVQFRGIYIDTNIDSVRMSDNGIYKAYVSARLFEDTNGNNVTSGAVFFSSPVGTMVSSLEKIDEQGNAASVFEAEVLPTNQNNIIITSELSSSSAVFSESEEFDIPGVEILINTVDDEIMGDGEGWALVKATLRESSNHKAIPLTDISWSTTLGTILGQSKTNTSGHTIDTLRIENAVGTNTNVTITANYGDNISVNDILTFIQPVNNNRLIMGFEPDTTAKDTVPCDIGNEFATRDVGISALYVNANSNPIGGQTIVFSIVPNYFAAICPTTVTVDTLNGRALVMLAYPPQNGGEIVRVWGEASDGTRGSIDVILPKDTVEVE